MIYTADGYFQINTAHTSYALGITARGDAEHYYYGRKVRNAEPAVLHGNRHALLVNSLYPEGMTQYGIDDMCFEYSFAHRGDSRSCALHMCDDAGENFDFVFDRAYTGRDAGLSYACSYGYNESLTLVFRCTDRDIELQLWYLVYPECDVITRFTRIVNRSDAPVHILNAASAQLDFKSDDVKLVTFDGAWARERYKSEKKVERGIYCGGSTTGMSSPECNPFFMVAESGADNRRGDVYAFNLVYSGNHCISVQRDVFDGVRVMNGINGSGFRYTAEPGESFTTPESVMTFSDSGYNGVSGNMHSFVTGHILRKKGEYPFMLNTWEAMYFDMSADKLKKIGDLAAKQGYELLVIDDGWFVGRDDDTTSLGDWRVDRRKFPGGLREVSDALAEKGVATGIWFEPEMVSTDSDLYRAHPEWTLIDEGVRRITGRGQYILDMTDPQVRDYLFDSMSDVIREGGIKYIKWDFNRRFAEIGKGKDSGSYLYRYVQGLYMLLDRLNKEFPSLVIEGCASGGGRFDLGMLCFCSFIWVSDNTNPYSRVHIQEGTSYGYPPCVMLNHVSASPNHQTGRISSVRSRIAVAKTGVFGCQADISRLPEDESAAIAAAGAEYKKYRDSLPERRFYRLSDGFGSNCFVWLETYDKGAELTIFSKRFQPVSPSLCIKLTGLDSDAVYRVRGDGLPDEGICVHGDTLERCGFTLPQNYTGNALTEGMTDLRDDSVAVYTFEKQ